MFATKPELARAMIGRRHRTGVAEADLWRSCGLLDEPPIPVTVLRFDKLVAVLVHLERRADAERDALPPSKAVHYVRDVLADAGVLPSRDEHLEQITPWLDQLLATRPPGHARLIHPYAHSARPPQETTAG